MVQNQWFIISGIAGENCQKILEGKQVLLGTRMGSPRVCKWNVFWLQMWYMCLFKVSQGRLSDSEILHMCFYSNTYTHHTQAHTPMKWILSLKHLLHARHWPVCSSVFSFNKLLLDEYQLWPKNCPKQCINIACLTLIILQQLSPFYKQRNGDSELLYSPIHSPSAGKQWSWIQI